MSTGTGEYPFVVVLRNRQARNVRRMGVLSGLLAAILLLSRLLSAKGSWITLVVLSAVSAMLARNFIRLIRNRPFHSWPLLTIAGLGLLLIPPANPAGGLFLLTAYLERFARRPREIGFAEDHIRFGGWRPSKYGWEEVSNVVLRDGLLTIDFADNRLFQEYADDLDDDAYDGTEDEFNAWSAERIRQSRQAQ